MLPRVGGCSFNHAGPLDYDVVNSIVTFSQESGPGSGLETRLPILNETSSQTIVVYINNDSALERDEEFYLTLQTSDPKVDISLRNTTEITIIDDDGMFIHVAIVCTIMHCTASSCSRSHVMSYDLYGEDHVMPCDFNVKFIVL